MLIIVSSAVACAVSFGDTFVDVLWTPRLLHCTHCAEKLDMHSAYNVDAVALSHFSVAEGCRARAQQLDCSPAAPVLQLYTMIYKQALPAFSLVPPKVYY